MDYRKLSIIIPVYNEESTVSEVIRRIIETGLPLEKEIIVIDDGSNDRTREILNVNRNVTRLYHTPVNIGKGAAVRIGLTMVKGDIILIQDADLELDPGEYSQLIAPILNGECSVVYGSRFLKNNRKIPVFRKLANLFLTKITNLLFGANLTDMETAYKVFTSEVADGLLLSANRFEIEPEITAKICRLGFQIKEVPISYNPRTRSEGKKIKWRDGISSLWTLIKCRFGG